MKTKKLESEVCLLSEDYELDWESYDTLCSVTYYLHFRPFQSPA